VLATTDAASDPLPREARDGAQGTAVLTQRVVPTFRPDAVFRIARPTWPGELAALERVQPPSMTRTVNCLHEGGYVVRRKNAADGRQVVVALSEKGGQTLAADRRRREAWLAQRLRELTPDERSLLRQAAPILERLASS